LTEPIRKQVSALFSHVFTNKAIYVAISRSYDRQTDTWSCGYRSIACMVDLARQRSPCEMSTQRVSLYSSCRPFIFCYSHYMAGTSILRYRSMFSWFLKIR
uniref:ULP_PROTEASE domain-containing protein n=1 Tax=Angiostrongylus cantonensis TaxID=6313 RepID=A0A0K0DC25_ANGCA